MARRGRSGLTKRQKELLKRWEKQDDSIRPAKKVVKSSNGSRPS
jgi:DNA-binding CsgD family transcriptional regulator